MKAKEILDAYLTFLWGQFQTDMSVLSNWWMWAALLIPAIFYILFMFVKWYILLFPIWLPIKLARIAFSKKPSYISTGNFVTDMREIRRIASERIDREKKE